jgi:hypothetical protein
MATISGKRQMLSGSQSLSYVLGVGAGMEQVLRNAKALLIGKGGDGGQYPAQGNGNIINVVHQADGFSGQWHGIPFWFEVQQG